MIEKEPMFAIKKEDLEKNLDSSKYIGRSANQAKEFIEEYINPILEEYKNELGKKAEINV